MLAGSLSLKGQINGRLLRDQKCHQYPNSVHPSPLALVAQSAPFSCGSTKLEHFTSQSRISSAVPSSSASPRPSAMNIWRAPAQVTRSIGSQCRPPLGVLLCGLSSNLDRPLRRDAIETRRFRRAANLVEKKAMGVSGTNAQPARDPQHLNIVVPVVNSEVMVTGSALPPSNDTHARSAPNDKFSATRIE